MGLLTLWDKGSDSSLGSNLNLQPTTHLAVAMSLSVNELPVIRYPCYAEELWDRQGTSIPRCQREMYSK